MEDLHFRVTGQMRAAVERAATAEGRSVSDWVRRALAQQLAVAMPDWNGRPTVGQTLGSGVAVNTTIQQVPVAEYDEQDPPAVVRPPADRSFRPLSKQDQVKGRHQR